MNTSLGAVREMLYCYIEWPERSPLTPAEAYADMKWFRSNIRRGSRLALFALAFQFLLSFGHFHSSSAQATAPTREPMMPLGRSARPSPESRLTVEMGVPNRWAARRVTR